MANILILGASGRISRWLIDMLADSDHSLTLFARSSRRIGAIPANTEVIEGDVFDTETLREAVRGQDIVFVGLGGDIAKQSRAVVSAMESSDTAKRIIQVNAIGIFREVPGEFGRWHRAQIGGRVLDDFLEGSDIIEASSLEHTVLRPAWLTDVDEIDYEITQRDEPYKGTVVSRRSVAALSADIINGPGLYLNENIGVNKPGTDGDRPVW